MVLQVPIYGQRKNVSVEVANLHSWLVLDNGLRADSLTLTLIGFRVDLSMGPLLLPPPSWLLLLCRGIVREAK